MLQRRLVSDLGFYAVVASDTPEFVDLVNRLRALLDSEYRRGQTDATRRIIEAAQGEASPSSARQQSPAAANGAEHPREPRQPRAPRGAPEALVRRVLMDRGSQGAAATDI